MGCLKLKYYQQESTLRLTPEKNLWVLERNETPLKKRLSTYTYGFQGQETDPETGLVNYKFRMHDPRLGRFFAVDPLTKSYPHYTPYSFSGNRVIDRIELEGLEEALPWYLTENKYGGKPVLTLGIGEFPVLEKREYYDWYFTRKNLDIAVSNAVVITWNGVAGSWNEGRVGKNNSGSLTQASKDLEGFFEDATTEDYIKLAKDPSFYESMISILGTGYLLKRIGGPKVKNKRIPFRSTGGGGYTINPKKFNYFFGRVVKGNQHNILRSAQNKADLAKLGITTESQLTKVFDRAIKAPNLRKHVGEFGTTITRKVTVGDTGAIEVGFFYEGGNMTITPKVVTIRPKL